MRPNLYRLVVGVFLGALAACGDAAEGSPKDLSLIHI